MCDAHDAGASAAAPAATSAAGAVVEPHYTPTLLLQAALASTTNPSNSSEATSYLQGWVEESDDGIGASWQAAAELVRLIYPPTANRNLEHCIGQHQPPIDVVEQAIIAHQESAHAAATSPSSQAVAISIPNQLHVLRTTSSGVRTLLLTLLNTKIRHSPSSVSPTENVVASLLDSVWCGLVYLSGTDGVGEPDVASGGEINSLCSTVCALAVRTKGGVPMLLQMAFAGAVNAESLSSLSGGGNSSAFGSVSGASGRQDNKNGRLGPIVALKIMARIPAEAAECSTCPVADIEADMLACVGFVLDVVCMVLNQLQQQEQQRIGANDGTKLALQVLSNWAGPCHITLTQISSVPLSSLADPTSIPKQQRPSLLDMLISVLSQPTSQSVPFDVVVAASEALMVPVLDGADFGTPTRLQASVALLGAIPSRGFLLNPIKVATEAVWEGDEAVRSLSNLASTIAAEEVDLVAEGAVPGCLELVDILLGLQVHRVHSAAIAPLETWLAVQDVPPSDRHPNFSAPLFGRVVQALLLRASYPRDFVSWEEDETDTLDRQEFDEMRRLASDILTSTYYLLRVDYIDVIVSSVSGRQSSWEAMESALWCLCAVSRDIVDEVKKNTDESNKAAKKLVGLAQQLCASDIQRQHVLVREAVATFLGKYSPIWNIHLSDSILDILAKLKAYVESGTAQAAAKATRQVLLGCSKSLILISQRAHQAHAGAVGTPTRTTPYVVSVALGTMMETVLSRGEEESVRLVAEGSARLCVQLRDWPLVQHSLCAVVDPIRTRLSLAFEHIQEHHQQQDQARLESCFHSLSSCLGAFEEVCRFCDVSTASSGDGMPKHHPLVEALTAVWPVITDISLSQTCRSHESTMTAVLAVHSALLSNTPELMAPHFPATVTFIVKLYEDQNNSAALDYVAAAVEQFGSAGSGEVASFSDLLAHLTRCTTSYLTTSRRPRDCPSLVEAYLEMCRRYLLYCPHALVACPEFSSIFALAVGCLGECSGNDCRAALLLMAQIIGYKNLRVSQTTSAVLNAASGTIDHLISRHGEAICKKCISSLSGSGPQMLWPACSECLYALVSYLCSVSGGEPLAWKWMCLALEADAKRLSPETRQAVISILFGFAKDKNSKSKPRAKMLLTDYAKLCSGDSSPAVLTSYSV
mmetsp:Transcript_4028/g.8685  ORF Transcript_4028/g.8685 Transcript_4028/m.8685 type:complete len:1153 (-) Transcript_4028:182-3640(-)